jgi:hypothetical protein
MPCGALYFGAAVSGAPAASYLDGHFAVMLVALKPSDVNRPVNTTSESSLNVSGTTPE